MKEVQDVHKLKRTLQNLGWTLPNLYCHTLAFHPNTISIIDPTVDAMKSSKGWTMPTAKLECYGAIPSYKKQPLSV